MKGEDISRENYLDAIEECNSLSREVFRSRYGFGESRKFPLLYDGREYDSKAIVGRAYALAHPEEQIPAWRDGLSGGIGPGSAGYLLKQAGFELGHADEDGPRAWVIRAGEHGEAEDLALAQGRAVLGWSQAGALAHTMSRETIKDMLQHAYGETRTASLGQQAGMLYRFLHDVQIGDVVALPLQSKPKQVAIGWIAGDYEHLDDPDFVASDAVNTRQVTWITKDAQSANIDGDLRAAFQGQGTLREIGAPNAAARLVAAAKSSSRPIHLVVKWSARHGADTVVQHMGVASEFGAVWWGLRGRPAEPKIGRDTLARIRSQLAAATPTNVFLYGPTCWRTVLSEIAVSPEDVEQQLVPDSYPEGQEYGLWVRLSNFEEIDRQWLLDHLELAKTPGVALADKSLRQTTNPLLVLESDNPPGPDRHAVWWVNQGTTYKAAQAAAVLWAPKVAKNGRDLAHWRALEDARVGDHVLHYANSNLRAVGTVTAAAVDAKRPFGSDEDWQEDGRLVRVASNELPTALHLSEIPSDWRVQEGDPFTKDGGVRQGYFFPLSERFVGLLAERFPQLALALSASPTTPVTDSQFDLATLRTQTKSAGLELPDGLLAEVLGALKSGKHIILTGPPGTAKTTLGQLVAQTAHAAGLCDGWVPTTATADWTTYDTIGGLRPKNDLTLAFQPGHFLAALESNQWLVIDELNRSNFDRAFGQFFTVLSGQTVTLPHERALGNGPITLVPADAAPPTQRADVVDVPQDWRIIATMNVFDKTLLFELSYALMRRFAFIEVPSPPKDKFVALIERWADGDEQAAEVALALLGVRKIADKDIGPASYRDIVRYARARSAIDEPAKGRVIFDAFYSFLLPQFEGIDDAQGRELHDVLRTVVLASDWPRLTRTLNTVLGLELADSLTSASVKGNGSPVNEHEVPDEASFD
jgi:MoxR-like ATPase